MTEEHYGWIESVPGIRNFLAIRGPASMIFTVWEITRQDRDSYGLVIHGDGPPALAAGEGCKLLHRVQCDNRERALQVCRPLTEFPLE